LVAVSANDGPKGLLDALDIAAGCRADRLAIYVTEVEQCPDAELVELVELEAKYLLEGTGVIPYRTAESLPVLHSDDPFLGQRVEALAHNIPREIGLGKPDRSPDW